MNITLFSFISAVFWHSIFIVIIYFLRKTQKFKQYFGMPWISFLYVFSLIRMVLPIELPNTIMLRTEQVYPLAYRALSENHIWFAQKEYSVLCLLIFAWILVGLMLLIRYVAMYRKAMKGLLEFSEPCSLREINALEKVKREAGKDLYVSLCTIPKLKTPLGIGIFKKHILLPEKDYIDEELHYILLHEYTHFVNKDIITKLLISIFCIIFWWNPVVYLLKKDLEQTLEIKCDLSVAAHLNINERITYLQTIIKTIKNFVADKKIPYISAAFFGQTSEAQIKERFSLVMGCDGTKKTKTKQILLCCGCILIMFLSYSVVLQPGFDPPAIKGELHSGNAYLKQIGDMKYELYIDNESQGFISKDEAGFYMEDGFTVIKED